MSYVIKILGFANGAFCPIKGDYVKTFDPDLNGGRGHIMVTRKTKNAMKFPTKEKATEFYLIQSKVTPLRPDGQPNRPLTGFTVEIVEA